MIIHIQNICILYKYFLLLRQPMKAIDIASGVIYVLSAPFMFRLVIFSYFFIVTNFMSIMFTHNEFIKFFFQVGDILFEGVSQVKQSLLPWQLQCRNP